MLICEETHLELKADQLHLHDYPHAATYYRHTNTLDSLLQTCGYCLLLHSAKPSI